MLTRQFPIVILLVFNLLFAKEIQGQASKVVIVNLDSLRNQSVIGEWEQALREETNLQEYGQELVDSFIKEQLVVQAHQCLSPAAWEEQEKQLKKHQNEIRKLERKMENIERLLSPEINNFLMRQVLLLLPEVKLNFKAAFLSIATPVFVDETVKKDLIYLSYWFIQEINSRPAILEDWLSFRQNLITN